MKKYCNQCNREFDANSRWCDQCGSELTTQVTTVQGPSIQQDNRIHKGDKTNIAGDSISAQNVDKRTFITQKSETKMYCECQLSGSRVPMEDIRRCTKCHRAISQKYFNEEFFLCKECYEKKMQAEDKVGSIPPLVPPVTQPTTTPSTRSSSKLSWIIILFLLVVITLGAIILIPNPSSNSHLVTQENTPASAEPTTQHKKQTQQQMAPTPVIKTSAQKEIPVVRSTSETASSSTPAPTGNSAYLAGNYEQALILLQKELDKGDGSAAYTLAKMYSQGKGVTSNVRKAFSYMRQAAELDYSDAYYELAEMYRFGDGTETNRAKAKTWYEKTVATNAKNADKAAEKLNLY